ncbi:MAG TPA: tetratricopeptide repeat protein [Chthoniobacteraceae bacterium]|nr:tetratricopeptide repeat protein [Chthoniobacteraceae bacterium]
MAIKTEKELSPNGRALWLKAITAVELRNHDYAISLIQTILKETPEFLEGRKLLRKAEILATKGKKSMFGGFSTQGLKAAQTLKKDPKAALDLAEKMLENDPYNAQGNHLLKDAALALNLHETAVFALRTLAEGNPKDTKILHELGELLYKDGDNAGAVEIYNRIVEIDPADLRALKRGKDAAASNTMKSGGWETAKDYRDLIKNKDQAISLEQKNRVVKSEDVIEAQLAEFHQRVEQEPQNIDLARRIADLYEQQGTLQTAIDWYSYANDLSKGTDNWLLRKLSDLRLRQINDGIKERKEWLALAGADHEEAPRIQQELEDLEQQARRWKLEEARKRVERNPTDLQFRFELGEQLMNNGDYTAAIPELQKARNNPNVRIKAMGQLAQCYVGKNMLDLAIKTFSEAAGELLEMDTTKKEILYKMGLAHEQLGQGEKALECFKQIYEVDYGYGDVATRVESSYSGS